MTIITLQSTQKPHFEKCQILFISQKLLRKYFLIIFFSPFVSYRFSLEASSTRIVLKLQKKIEEFQQELINITTNWRNKWQQTNFMPIDAWENIYIYDNETNYQIINANLMWNKRDSLISINIMSTCTAAEC